MKRNQVKSILVNQTKRRNTVFGLICVIVLISIFAISSFLMYANSKKSYYVNYDEKSNIDYKVYLKENEFFDDKYLENNKQYIASLIDYIAANFEYSLSLAEKDVDYKYAYRIESNVDVKSVDTNNSLYNVTEELMNVQMRDSNKKNVTIKESLNIDYNQYNDLIKKFVKVYGLDDVKSTLTINMYVTVIGSCEDFMESSEQESVITLSIPLTTKTMAIDISNNLINTENNVMQCKTEDNNGYIFLILGIIFALGDIATVVYTINYEIKTRTAENIYEKELKKILNNYGSYIQILNNDFDFKNYQMLKLSSFTDMLEIRDTIRQPILMKENAKRTGAYFVIPSSTKMLYVYRLKVSDIEKNIQQNSSKELEIESI